ncbi:MAG: response regulator [Gemmatimonadota bacterium]|nr:MAG: response regulator [Gemmatimonadota bacterium]
MASLINPALPTGRPRILAIEDVATIRRFYDRFGEAYGYDITLAPTGTAALSILESGQDFDVILLDVRLPGVSGRALWKTMELTRPELCPRVVMVTADMMSENTQQLVRDTGCPYLEKPFSTQQLELMIRRVLESERRDPGEDRLFGGV